MATRLTEASAYAHLWCTPRLAAIFEERARLQAWLDILVALAAAQAETGIIPGEAAEQIAAGARVEALDLDLVAAETRASGHSTLGLIRALQAVLPEPAAQFAYYGATVQDLTDTWTGLVMRDVAAMIRTDLCRTRSAAIGLARRHRAAPMPGRTHAQLGAPITFGLKAATWADELGRHVQRLDQATPRWATGQLAGAVGALGFFDPHGVALRRAFCTRLGLADPGISWTASRDRVAEFGAVLAMVTATLARIGTEVLELSRPEIGELSEPPSHDTVGSITMPHKRNPEISEHLDTLARLVRANAAVLVEGMVGMHERDGRGWKAEWAALPEVALCAGTAAELAGDLVEGLRVHPDRMLANLDPGRRWASEQVLAALSPMIGKHRAQSLLQSALHAESVTGPGPATDGGQRDIVDAVAAELVRHRDLDAAALTAVVLARIGPAGTPLDAGQPALRTAVAMTDAVVSGIGTGDGVPA